MNQTESMSSPIARANPSAEFNMMNVALTGELTREDVRDLTLLFPAVSAASAMQPLHVVLDFSLVTHIDFRSLHLLAQWSSALKTFGGTMVLAGLSLYLKTIFRTVNLLAVFEVFESQTEAVASFNRRSQRVQTLFDVQGRH